MNRNLQEGKTSIYLQYISTAHNIDVKQTESEVKENIATLRLTLLPNNTDMHKETLQSIAIDNENIIDGFIQHLRDSLIDVTLYQLELLSEGNTRKFNVTPALNTQGDLRALYLTVIPLS